jgi:hypothetical protein
MIQMDGEVVQVDTLQAFHLLSLHDAYLARTLATSPVFDYGRLVSRVRAAGYFRSDISLEERGSGWAHWIKEECTRRWDNPCSIETANSQTNPQALVY